MKLKSLLFSAALISAAAMPAYADITVKVNVPDVVEYVPYNQEVSSYMLSNETTVLDAAQMYGTLYLDAKKYAMTCVNETTGQQIEVTDTNKDQYRAIIDSQNPNGSVISITVREISERYLTVHFDNPEAGYVVTLTSYNLWGDTCLPEDTPMESNEDEEFFPDGDGNVELPFEYNRRFRIRYNENYYLIKATDDAVTNPHFTGYLPASHDVIEIGMWEVGSFHVINVFTGEAGSFLVRCVGEMIDDVVMNHAGNYSKVNLSLDPQRVYFKGENYSIRSYNKSIQKIEITNDGVTAELPATYGTYTYTPKHGDDMVIYTYDPTTGIDAIDSDDCAAPVYTIDGRLLPAGSPLPAGIYIRAGKKVVVR